MRRTGIAIALIVVAALAGTAYAQQQGNSAKQPNQTVDRGLDDDTPPPGQAKKTPVDRDAKAVTVTVRANGVAVAELDESFDEALVVRINPDGTRTFIEVQGLARAAEEVHRTAPAPVSAVVEEK